MFQRKNYEETSTSKLYQLAKRILGKNNISELHETIAQLEKIRERFTQKPCDYKPRLRVVWPDD